MNSNQTEEYIDLGVLLVDFWKGIKKYWYGIIIITVLAIVVFGGYKQSTYVPMYRAQAAFTVKTVSTTIENETSTSYSFYYDKSTASQIGTTFPYIISSEVFMTRLKEYLGISYINGSISASTIENSNLVTLSVTSRDQQDALTILEGVIEVYPEIVQYVIGNTKLDIIKEPEVGSEPYNKPGKKMILVRGAEIGLVLSFGLIFLYAFFRDTVRQESDLKKIMNVTCLAQIPEIKKRAGLNLAQNTKDGNYVENMYALQNRVDYLMKKNNMKVLVMTSTGPSEGKSTISANLAMTMARRGKRVLLIDGDLRKPDLRRHLGLEEQTASLQNFFAGGGKTRTEGYHGELGRKFIFHWK